EDVHEPGLRHLRDGLHRLAVAPDRHEIWRGREVEVPQIVVQALEVPDALAGARVEREHAVGEQVVAGTVRAVKVERRRTGRRESPGVLLIDRDAGPRVRAAGDLPRVLRPGVVAELAGPWNRVERPADLSRVDVVRADVAGRGRQRLGDGAAD